MQIETDFLLVGSGLGATAAGRVLASAGRRVILIPGVGRTRSPHIDGGIVGPAPVESVFGPGAPLGDLVDTEIELQRSPATGFRLGRRRDLAPGRTYRRSTLQGWAMERAVDAGATFLDDFIEGKVAPTDDGRIRLTSERDDRVITAGAIALCEGADPRIALRVKLRPDYAPDDQLHFARTIVTGARIGEMRHGAWRTSWGMPVQVMLTPQHDGVLAAVLARIENVMRSNRSSKDALNELLASAEFWTLGIGGEAREVGMELVPLRTDPRKALFVRDRLVMGIDFSGVIDPRCIVRANLTIRAGVELGKFLRDGSARLDDWQDVASTFVRDAVPRTGAYHDEQATGFLEEGSPHVTKVALSRVAKLVRGRR